ncbi:MAG: fibronectin type III-like domain-contianing protein, partial [Acidobacteriaceae bacterium]
FGYGLSYTSFRYSDLRLSAASLHAGDPLHAEVTVTNTGDREGDAVAQLYLIPPAGDGDPLRSLEGFERVRLAPHASTVVHFILDARDLSEVDAAGQRAVRAGNYQLFAGGASPQSEEPASGATARFSITGSLPLPD